MAARQEILDKLQPLWQNFGKPSASKLHLIAKKRGIHARKNELDQVVKSSGERAIFKRLNTQAGKTASTAPGDVIQVDVIDKKTDKKQGFSGILCVIDVFSRVLRTRVIKTKAPRDVVGPMRDILDDLEEKPKLADMDAGNEFTNEVARLFEEKGIEMLTEAHKYDFPHGVLDRAIQTLRQNIERELSSDKSREKEWPELVERATALYNDTPHSSLLNEEPDDIREPGHEPVEFMLLQDNARKFQHNQELASKRVAEVEDTKVFRRPVGPRKKFERVFEAKFGDKEHLQKTEGTLVFSRERPTEPIDVKHIQAVPVTQTTAHQRVTTDVARENNQRDILDSVAQELANILEMMPNRRQATSQLAMEMNRSSPAWREAMKKARVSHIRELFELYPEYFELSSNNQFVKLL